MDKKASCYQRIVSIGSGVQTWSLVHLIDYSGLNPATFFTVKISSNGLWWLITATDIPAETRPLSKLGRTWINDSFGGKTYKRCQTKRSAHYKSDALYN